MDAEGSALRASNTVNNTMSSYNIMGSLVNGDVITEGAFSVGAYSDSTECVLVVGSSGGSSSSGSSSSGSSDNCNESTEGMVDAYSGGVTKYVNDHNKPAVKDNVISKLLPEHVPECLGSVVTGHCMSTKTIEKIDNLLKSGAVTPSGVSGSKDTSTGGPAVGRWKVLGPSSGNKPTGAPEKTVHTQIIEQAKDQLGCSTEVCILEALEPHLGKSLITNEITSNFKIKGPTDNKLLSNINIDAIMNKYSELFPGFFPYNFNMRNFASYRFRKGYVEHVPDTLATIQFSDLFANGHTCCGCVINDDTYQGPGTHWMALFADTRGGKWSVEFFNSGANAPAPEWVNWMTKTKSQMEDIMDALKKGNTLKVEGTSGSVGTSVAVDTMPKNPRAKNITTREESREFCCETARKIPQRVDIICCSEIRHQQSKTECGLYSLFYIFARLNGVPYEYFMKNPVPDQLMFEFRQVLFNSEKGVNGGKFNWDQYRGQVSVVWE